MKPYKRSLKQTTRQLRTGMTDAEQVLWKCIRRKQIQGVQFYRQKPLLDFIVDFYCAKAHLVIELDGSQHLEPGHQQKDAVRDQALGMLGLCVLRFDNRQVLMETDSVVAVIDEVVLEQLSQNLEKNSDRDEKKNAF